MMAFANITKPNVVEAYICYRWEGERKGPFGYPGTKRRWLDKGYKINGVEVTFGEASRFVDNLANRPIQIHTAWIETDEWIRIFGRMPSWPSGR